MITEKTQLIPSAKRLLFAGAPFLMCVFCLFVIGEPNSHSTQIRKKRSPGTKTDSPTGAVLGSEQNLSGGNLTPKDPPKSVATRWKDATDFVPLDVTPLDVTPLDVTSLDVTSEGHHHSIAGDHEPEGDPRDAVYSELAPFDVLHSSSGFTPSTTIGFAEHFPRSPEAPLNAFHADHSNTPTWNELAAGEHEGVFVLPGVTPDAGKSRLATSARDLGPLPETGPPTDLTPAHFSLDPDPFILQVQASSAVDNPEGVGVDDGSEDPEEFGAPPPRRVPLFLQESTVLLEVGEYQYESGLRYSTNANVFPVSGILDGTALVANATRKQQTIITPLELRVGIADELQMFINLPLGYSKLRTTAQTTQHSVDDRFGVGDLTMGLTKLLWEWKEDQTRLLGSISISAPTGPADFAINSLSDYAALGRGYWTAGGGVNLVHIIDPLAFFGGVGYTHTFQTDAGGDQTLDAGNTFFYSLGLGYAVNPEVSLNAAFAGGYSGELRLNETKLAGTGSEPLSLKVAATFANVKKKPPKKNKAHHKYLTATIKEPFLRFGLTGSATDVDFGIRVTY